MSFSDWRRKVLGLSEAEALEAAKERTERESRRGAKESAARWLADAEREYERDPCAINKAYLDMARKQMP